MNAPRWKYDPRVAWQSIGDEVVVLDLVAALSLGLNETGSFLWTRLPELDEEGLAEALAREYRLEPEVARADVRSFLHDMEKRGLVLSAG